MKTPQKRAQGEATSVDDASIRWHTVWLKDMAGRGDYWAWPQIIITQSSRPSSFVTGCMHWVMTNDPPRRESKAEKIFSTAAIVVAYVAFLQICYWVLAR